MQKIIEEFDLFPDWEEKYAYIIELGKNLEPMPEKMQTQENRVPGCMSQVWLFKQVDDQGKIKLLANSDAFIVKGLLAIIIQIFSGRTLSEIKNINMQKFFQDLGLKEHLSPSRSNGFFSIISRIKAD